MNAPLEKSLTLVSDRGTALAESASSMFNLDGMQAMQKMAELMSTATVTIPKHLVNKPGDCLAIVMQAAQWEMNPYAVAQKTHLTQGGALGYEAQLINAVVITRAPIQKRPEFKFVGDWSKILGKVKEERGQSGGKYYVAAWDKADEAGLGVECSVLFNGETEPRRVEVLLSQCWPRFSTQWATDPQQQITYAAVRKLGRRYAPDVILGVYTPEELEEGPPPSERDMGKAEVVDTASMAANVRSKLAGDRKPAPAKAKAPTLDDVLTAIRAATTPEQMSEAAGKCAALLDPAEKETGRAAYRERLNALKAQAQAQTQESGETSAGPTYADIADQIGKAQSTAALAAARDLIRSVRDDTQRSELVLLADRREGELTSAGGA